MVTGASTADLAVILIDARKGVLTQTRRHCYLAHLIGIRNIVLAVNKMDLVGYDQAHVRRDRRRLSRLRRRSIGIADFIADPDLGLQGRQYHQPLGNTCPGTTGPTLIEHLETVELDVDADQAKPFRMPVQWVNRPNLDFRGFSGLIASGTVKPGDAVRVLPSGKTIDDQPDRHARRRSRRGRRRPVGHAELRRRGRLLARRRHRRRRRSAARSPTSSKRRSSGWPTRRCCRAAPTG